MGVDFPYALGSGRAVNVGEGRTRGADADWIPMLSLTSAFACATFGFLNRVRRFESCRGRNYVPHHRRGEERIRAALHHPYRAQHDDHTIARPPSSASLAARTARLWFHSSVGVGGRTIAHIAEQNPSICTSPTRRP